MEYKMVRITQLVPLVFITAFSLPAEAKMYKWVDDAGVTHYGETIPPQYADKDRVELNRSGRVVNTTDVLTPDELRAQREAQAQEKAEQREQERAKQEQQRHDRMLVNTYSNSAEIDLARKRNLQQIESRINSFNAQIKIIEDNLTTLNKEADGYIQKKRPVPQSLQEDVIEMKSRLEKLEADLQKPISEREALNARFDADKARFHELTGK